jgi:hypothetical protein
MGKDVLLAHDVFVSCCVVGGFIGIPFILVHPFRPSLITAGLTIVGCLAWFLSSYFVVMTVCGF